MDRLTKLFKAGRYGLVKVKDNEQEVDSPYPNTLRAILESFQQLGAYEDTGLMPNEVTAMKDENARLTVALKLAQTRREDVEKENERICLAIERVKILVGHLDDVVELTPGFDVNDEPEFAAAFERLYEIQEEMAGILNLVICNECHANAPAQGATDETRGGGEG